MDLDVAEIVTRGRSKRDALEMSEERDKTGSTEKLARIEAKGQREIGIADLPPELIPCILGKLGFDDAKTARLVCRTWNAEICMLIKDKTFAFVTCKAAPGYDEWAHSMSEFVTLQNRATRLFQIPTILHNIHLDLRYSGNEGKVDTLLCENPHLCSAINQIHISDFPPARDRFAVVCVAILKKCASSLSHLDFSSCATYWVLDVFSQLMGLTFPELQFLGFSFNLTLFDPQLPDLISVLSSFFRDSPKLCGLRVNESFSESWNSMETVLDLHRIQHLHYSFYYNLNRRTKFVEQLLCQKQFPPLKSLTYFQRDVPKEFYHIIHYAAETLEYLEFYSKPIMDEFSPLPRLKVLALLHDGSSYSLSDKWMSEKTPALKELRVQVLHLTGIPPINELPVFPNLQKISLRNIFIGQRPQQKTKGISALGKCFPNLKSWEITSDSVTLFDLFYSRSNRLAPPSRRLKIEELKCYSTTLFKALRLEYGLLKGMKRLTLFRTVGVHADRESLKKHPTLPDLDAVYIEPRNSAWRDVYF